MYEYEELRIRIRPFGPSRFLVAVSGPSCATDVIAVDGEPAALRARWDRLVEADLGHAPMGERHTVEQLRELGRAVYGLLFGDGVQAAPGHPGRLPYATPGGPPGNAGFGPEVPGFTATGLGPPAPGPGFGPPAPAPGFGPPPPAPGGPAYGPPRTAPAVPPPPGGSRSSPTAACLASALDLAQRTAPGRRLRLRFDLPPRLRELPLETLCAPADLPHQSLALNPGYSLVRSLPGGPLGRRLPTPADEPSLIRLLVACASPPGAGPALRLDAEVAALRQELPEVAVRTTVVEAATRERLETALAAHGDLPTAVLLIAHGRYDEELGKGVVQLETESGGVDSVPADLLSGILLKAPRLRLAVLNLCAGADSSGPDGMHAEPFSGLAQALVAGGLPAVVAMRGRVSDASAGRFSPELFKELAANRTVDEAVSTARRRISHLPRHTAVEWATPALFLHAECRHGWLFKAREVRDDGGAVADPLREGADALRAFQSPVGHVDATTLISAARFERDQGRWPQVQRILGTPTRQYEDEQRRLRTEAACELAWPELEKLCGLLAHEGDGAAAAAQLAVVHAALPLPLPGPLTARAERLRLAAELLGRARAAEAAADWDTAVRLYEEVAAAGLGRTEVPERLAAARTALRAASLRAAAERAYREGDWDAAAHAYAGAAALCPDDPATAARAAYVRGRSAESAGRWREAAAAYAECGGAPGPAPVPPAPHTPGPAPAPCAPTSPAPSVPNSPDPHVPPPGPAASPPGPDTSGPAAPRPAPDTPDTPDAPDTPSIADAALRRSYACGRAAAEDGDWAAAVAAFEECRSPGNGPSGPGGSGVPSGSGDPGSPAVAHLDADGRCAYARARLCRERADWDGALAWLGGLADSFADVADQVLYAHGRAADARGAWTGVIDGFGRLPDAYADGDVGVRRRYARARVAADVHRDWAAACALLAGVPDSAREGTVAPLRRKAEGRRAEARPDWAAACAIYGRAFQNGTAAPQAPAAPEPLHLYLYALARTHEAADRWHDALRVYRVLPDGWADVPARRRYAGARVGEERATGAAQWRAVAAAYEEIGGALDGADCAARCRYARLRAAEAEGEWSAVVAAAQALRGRPDPGAAAAVDAVVAYARGRIADAHQEWEKAAEAFGACPGHRDADAQLAYAQGRLLERDGRWSDAVAAYERAAGRLDRAEVRRRRLRRLLDLLPWADGLTHAPLTADPFALRDPTYPYLALREAGVHPGVSMAAVRDAPYTLLGRGGMSWSERVALDRLQLPGRRLQLDALLYRWHAPDAVRDALATLSPDDEHAGPGLVDVLCERFPEDAPLLLLLARGRDAAAAEWERRLAAAPGDMAVVHGLAVARLWQAQELEQSGAWEHATRTWEQALAYWSTLLSDDAYWDGWRAERAACYARELAPEDMNRLRWELSRHLSAQLSAYEQRHTEEGRPQQAEEYGELAAFLEAELGGARVLKDVGGLPGVPGARGALACGPHYLRLLDLQLPLAALAAQLDAAAKDGKDPGEYAARELRWAFSGLARSLALCAVHKFPGALDALPAFPTLTTLPEDCAGPAAAADPRRHIEGCGHCRDFLRRDPAYVQLAHRHARLLQDGVELAVRARLELSRSALADGEDGLGRALEQWERLVRVARRAGMSARAKKAVVRTALGRVEALVSEPSGPRARRGEGLDEAIALVEAVPPLLHPLDREVRDQLDGRLSSLYSMRGVWRGYTRTKHGMRSDVYGAEADLRRALDLNPASNHARDNLARALVFTLDERGDPLPVRLRHLHEALGLLDVGLGQALTHNYRETLGEALEELDRLLATDLGVAGMGALIRSDGAEPPPDEDDLASWAAELTDRAEAERARGDVRKALHHLIRATRADAMDPRVRRALLDAVRGWRAALTAEPPGAPPEEGTPP
ncbi:CHAT domain-containing protein [Streptomyces sp. NPDC047071]|uniref:CHAT domain-containing protein n=1 Tax=Streptomyces sp. NPDC047071 TaxID=3154808 RepID=UPI003456DB21